MFIASQQGNLDYIRILIEHKANVNVPDNKVSRISCCDRGNPRCRELKGVTPLFLAAREGKYDCLRALIEAKADVNHPTNEVHDIVHHRLAFALLDLFRNSQLFTQRQREARLTVCVALLKRRPT